MLPLSLCFAFSLFVVGFLFLYFCPFVVIIARSSSLNIAQCKSVKTNINRYMFFLL